MMRMTEEEFQNIEAKKKTKTRKAKKTNESKIKETDIQTAIKNWLLYKGWFCFKNHQSLGNYKGVADLYAIKNGKSIWIEVKKPNGRQSEHQIKFENDIKQHGGLYIIARGIEDLKELESI